jgi:hypothetical protein
VLDAKVVEFDRQQFRYNIVDLYPLEVIDNHFGDCEGDPLTWKLNQRNCRCLLTGSDFSWEGRELKTRGEMAGISASCDGTSHGAHTKRKVSDTRY